MSVSAQASVRQRRPRSAKAAREYNQKVQPRNAVLFVRLSPPGPARLPPCDAPPNGQSARLRLFSVPERVRLSQFVFCRHLSPFFLMQASTVSLDEWNSELVEGASITELEGARGLSFKRALFQGQS